MYKVLLLIISLVSLDFYPFLHAEADHQKHVLLVGGAGYIGSHVNKALQRAGYKTIVLDNFLRGSQKAVLGSDFFEGDMADPDLLDHIFTSYSIDAVMHFAAFKDVGESVEKPLSYYINNVSATLTLLEAMVRHDIKVFIFSSSAAIFGSPQADLIDEEHPCAPLNPYGQSKLMVETILKDLDRAYGLRFCALRYFNAAGADHEGTLKNYQTKESNLIPIVLRSLRNNSIVSIFGTDFSTPDGTCVRDYIHVDDLSTAHVLAMEKIFSGASSNCYNLGNGKGFSVREVVSAVEKVTGQKVQIIETGRRAGDPERLLASAEKAKQELGWQPRYNTLEDMIGDAWKAMQ